MPTYAYTAADSTGKIVKGREKADNRQDLVALLRMRDLYCTRVEQVEEKRPKARYKFKTKQLSIFCRQLASMLSAGVNLVKALHILMTQEDNVKAKEILRDIYEEMQRGRSFSEALEGKPGVFPPLFVGMVAAGEASGSLDMIIDRVSDNYAKEAKLQNTIRKAMIYPIVLGVVTVAIVILMFTLVMPQFIVMFTNPEDIPPLTQVMIGISDFLVNRWYIAVVIVVGIVAAVRVLLAVPVIRLFFDKMKLTIPKAGKLITTIYTARFGRTMANLFASGMQMVECIEKSVGTLNNAYIKKRFEEVVEDVKRGESLSASIAKIGIFEPIFTSTIFIGEESGRLDDLLAKSADYYDEESESAVQRLVAMLEPVMIIILGGVVALVLGAILPALYDSFGSVGGM